MFGERIIGATSKSCCGRDTSRVSDESPAMSAHQAFAPDEALAVSSDGTAQSDPRYPYAYEEG